ncbi:MAG: Trm112 family protein [Nitriliruptoraceae bacterium]
MLDERLLRIIVCPACRASLEYKERRRVLICTGCGHRYEVRDGIPILLPPTATAPDDGADTDGDDAGDDAEG